MTMKAAQAAMTGAAGLVPYRNGERCWVLIDRNGDEWPALEASAHYPSEREARERLTEAREEYEAVDGHYGPQDVIQRGVGCLLLFCAEPGCGEEYEGDEFAHVHWDADDPQTALDAAEDAEWKIGLDGQAYCPETIGPVDHTPVMEDGECSECGFAESDHRFLVPPSASLTGG